MDPIVGAALISGASNVLGGLTGGGKINRKAIRDQAVIAGEEGLRFAKRSAYQLPEVQVAGWKKAGIHPLAGLGMSSPSIGISSGGGGESSGPNWGNALSEMGQGVSRAVAAYASREEREMAKMSGKLQLENQQLQNDRLRSEIAIMHQPGSPPGMSAAGSNSDARYPAQAHMPMGFGDTAPLLRTGRDAKGNPVRVYNDDLGDNEVLQALTAFGYSIPDWLQSNVSRPLGKKLRSVSTRRMVKKLLERR